jgi:jumonji domain-containing protein 7
VNLWIGSSKSTTALHKDPYENIYVQIVGRKHFVLLPPIASVCVNERQLPTATYKPPDDLENLKAVLDEPAEKIPFPTWDPDKPNEHQTEFSGLIKPLRVTLRPGDILYLPSLWYHKVSQTSDPVEEFCLAVNYW